MPVTVYTKKSGTNQSIKYIDCNIGNRRHEEKWRQQNKSDPGRTWIPIV